MSYTLLLKIIIISRVRVSGILGSKSTFACPICLVPHDELANLGGTWPKRTKSGTFELLTRASEKKTKDARKRILKKQSLRFLTVSFMTLCYGTTYRCIFLLEHFPYQILYPPQRISNIYIGSASCNRAGRVRKTHMDLAIGGASELIAG
jgi:hypothetical protein